MEKIINTHLSHCPMIPGFFTLELLPPDPFPGCYLCVYIFSGTMQYKKNFCDTYIKLKVRAKCTPSTAPPHPQKQRVTGWDCLLPPSILVTSALSDLSVFHFLASLFGVITYVCIFIHSSVWFCPLNQMAHIRLRRGIFSLMCAYWFTLGCAGSSLLLSSSLVVRHEPLTVVTSLISEHRS